MTSTPTRDPDLLAVEDLFGAPAFALPRISPDGRRPLAGPRPG